METLEILQKIDSIAFTRSQIAFQVENFQGLQGLGNADRFTFNPQFVSGHCNEFAIILKVPILSAYPYTTRLSTESGVSGLTTGRRGPRRRPSQGRTGGPARSAVGRVLRRA